MPSTTGLKVKKTNTIGDRFLLILVDTLISELLDYLRRFVLCRLRAEGEGQRVEQALGESVDDPDHNLIN